MFRGRSVHFRWMIMTAALPWYILLILFVLNTVRLLLEINQWPPWDQLRLLPASSLAGLRDPDWFFQSLLAATAFAGTQILFLLPLWRKPLAAGAHGKSLLLSTVIAGGIGGGLVVLVIMALASFVEEMTWWPSPREHTAYVPVLGMMFVISWTVWSIIIWISSSTLWPETMLRRMIRILLSGTAIEVLCVLPLDIMIRRRTSCYCYSGSMFALYGAVAAVLWLAGPGIMIALLSKQRRTWREQHCPSCGYPKGPNLRAVCPECGEGGGTRERA